METIWVLTYIVSAWYHSGSSLEHHWEPRAQIMPSYEVCVATGKELKRITSRNVFLGVRCQELEIPTQR